MSIIDQMVKVKPAENSQQEYAELTELARQEGHVMFDPHDVIWKNNERVGLFHVEASPMVWAYFSQKCGARDSAMAINIMEQTLFRHGARSIIVPVRTDSPFHQHMESLGYKKDQNITYFYKNV